jgi:glyoxylase-like metal-dependent hydrolase (beta-lactamase superfamily II)
MIEKKILNLTVGAIATNCWIIPTGAGSANEPQTAVIIDPGDDADIIISTLKKNFLTPEYILLTHGHFDHIAAVPLLQAAFNPKPQIAIHRLDALYLGADAYAAHSISVKAAMGNTAFIDALWNEMPSPDILLEEGSEIGPFTTLHLLGHTHGSVAFWDKNAGNLFTGDTLFKRGYGRTDLPGGNEKKIFESLRRLFDMDGNITVYPGHGDITTIGQEAKY